MITYLRKKLRLSGMESFLYALQQLINSGRLQPAEPIICSHLTSFEDIIEATGIISDSNFNNLESLLIKILQINKGQLSMQCSFRIATCLLVLYSGKRIGMNWNLFQEEQMRPYPSTVYALAYVVDKIGKNSSSKIPGFVKSLLSLDNIMIQPALFGLTVCFKRARRELDSFAEKAFSLVKRALLIPNDTTRLLAIQFLKTLIKSNIDNEKPLLLMKGFLNSNQLNLLVEDKALSVVAKILHKKLNDFKRQSNSNQIDDWKISPSVDKKSTDEFNLRHVFVIIVRDFCGNLKLLNRKLLTLMSSTYIHNNLNMLFNNIYKNMPEEINTFIKLISEDDRRFLFQKVISDRFTNDHFNILYALALDHQSIIDISSIAFQMIKAPTISMKECAFNYFTQLPKLSPEISASFVQSMIDFILNPPQSIPKKNSEIRSRATIIAAIIENMPSIAYDYENNIRSAIIVGLSDKQMCYNGFFYSAIALATVVPKSFFSIEQVEHAIERYCSFISSIQYNNATSKIKINCEYVANMIGFFLIQYSYLKVSVTFFFLINRLKCFNSYISIIFMLKLFPNIIKSLSNQGNKSQQVENVNNEIYLFTSLIQDFINNNEISPTFDFLHNTIKSPMMLPSEIIQTKTKRPLSELPKLLLHINSNNFGNFFISLLPDFIASLPKNYSVDMIKQLFSNKHIPVLVLSLLKDSRLTDFFGLNEINAFSVFVDNLLNQAYSTESIIKTQILCDSIVISSKFNSESIYYLLRKIKTLTSIRVKCLLLSSVFVHYETSISEDIIIFYLFELNNIVQTQFSKNANHLFDNQFIQYTLFTLKVIYDIYHTKPSLLKIIENQPVFFTNLFHFGSINNENLSPYILQYAGQAFISWLSALSPEMNDLGTNIKDLSQQVIDCFEYSCSIPYGRLIYYQVIRAVYNFAHELIETYKIMNQKKKMECLAFPTSKGIPFYEKVEACGVFTDYAKIVDTDADFFELIPHVLMILQVSNDSQVSNFMVTLASNFLSHCTSSSNILEEKDIERLKSWINFIKLVSVNGILPPRKNENEDYNINSSKEVRKSCIFAINYLIPIIKSSKPFLNECLDDIMSSILRSLATYWRDLREECFKTLCFVIDSFIDSTNSSGHHILNLYESQFLAALKIGFSDFSISGAFMLKYLDYCMEIKNNEIIKVFSDGLKNTKTKETYYVVVASKLTKLAEYDHKIYDIISPLFCDFIEKFASIIKIAIDLFEIKNNPNWVELSKFRNEFESNFELIISSFLFLSYQSFTSNLNIQANINQHNKHLLTPERLFDFFLQQLLNSTEQWRVCSSYSGLFYLIKFDLLDFTDIKKCFSLIIEARKHHENGRFKELLIVFSEKLAVDKDSWIALYGYIALNKNIFLNDFQIKILAYLLRSGNDEMIKVYSHEIFEKLFNLMNQKEENHFNDLIHLLSILFDRISATSLDILISQSLNFESNSIQNNKLIFSLILMVLKRNANPSLSAPKIVQYSLDNFESGGIEIIGFSIQNKLQTLLKEYQLNSKLIKKIDEYSFKQENTFVADQIEENIYIKILRLSAVIISTLGCNNDDQLFMSSLNFSFNFVANNFAKSKELLIYILLGVHIWKISYDIDKILFKIAFSKLPTSIRGNITLFIEKYVANNQKSSCSIRLRSFASTNMLRASENNGHWQEL